MEKAPAEVLHLICAQLDFEDLANTRLASKTLAGVGAHHLVKRVRFHHSDESLLRLKELAVHPVYSQTVTELFFEAQLIEVVDRPAWMHHFSHTTEMPTMPTKSKGPRAMRAYRRALSKWEADGKQQYASYDEVVQSQNSALQAIGATLATVMRSFPKLVNFQYKSVPSCGHCCPCSQRFRKRIESYKAYWGRDTAHTARELKHVLCPGGKPLIGLQLLFVSDLNPKLFSSKMKSSIGDAFVSLKKISLTLRLPENDPDLGLPGYHHLNDGCLAQVLGRATSLSELTIKFFDATYDGPCTGIDNVLGEHSFPELTKLHLNYMSSEPDHFIETLKRQPKLKDLGLESMTIDDGSWLDVISDMRHHFDFEQVLFAGFLEDDLQVWDTEVIDVAAFRMDEDYFSLADTLEMYFLGPRDDAWNINPLYMYGDYRRPEEISMDYGFEDDSDFESDGGEAVDEEMSPEDGNATDGNATDGNATDGNATDGNATDGNAIDADGSGDDDGDKGSNDVYG